MIRNLHFLNCILRIGVLLTCNASRFDQGDGKAMSRKKYSESPLLMKKQMPLSKLAVSRHVVVCDS